jgi:CHAD domain-containing protein
MTKAWPVGRLDPDAPLDLNARHILRVRVGEFYSWEPVVSNPLATVDLHNLRISTKRLRYTLELYPSVFGDDGKRQIERIKALQEQLGNLHDLDVRIDLIADELVALTAEEMEALNRALASSHPSAYRALTTAMLRPPPDAPQSGLYGLLARQHAERQQTYRQFKSLWDQYALEGMRDDLARLSSTRVAIL